MLNDTTMSQYSQIPSEVRLLIESYVLGILETKKTEIKIISLISNTDISSIIQQKKDTFDTSEWEFKILTSNENMLLARGKMKRQLTKNEIDSDYLIFQVGIYVFIITGGTNRFINSGIFYMFKKIYSNVIISYITSKDIFELLSEFESDNEVELYYRSAVTKRMFGKPNTDVVYKRGIKYIPFVEAFKKSRSSNQWVDSIKLYSKGLQYDFSVSREGIIKYKKGSFSNYYNLLIKICKKYESKINLFKNRSRQDQLNYKTQPLILPFDNDIFNNKEIRMQFIETIKNYTFCRYSIVYSGNPHIHINLLDTLDNSMYSIRTYSDDSIVIGPQIRTSESSLMRITKYLLDNFRETIIQDLRGFINV